MRWLIVVGPFFSLSTASPSVTRLPSPLPEAAETAAGGGSAVSGDVFCNVFPTFHSTQPYSVVTSASAARRCQFCLRVLFGLLGGLFRSHVFVLFDLVRLGSPAPPLRSLLRRSLHPPLRPFNDIPLLVRVLSVLLFVLAFVFVFVVFVVFVVLVVVLVVLALPRGQLGLYLGLFGDDVTQG